MTEYTVRAGDTLGKIAQRFYKDARRYREIAAANNIINVNNIRVGQKLVIPADSNGQENSGVIPVSESHSAAPTTPKADANIEQLITAVQLKQIMPYAKQANIDKYVDPLNVLMAYSNINTPLRIAHFIAQLAHESASFNTVVENLNYSASALRKVFGKYFKTDEMANEYARKPEKIANRVYADRMENGDEASGDGWRYRGRGLIQLTGKANYRKCSDDIGVNILNNPDMVANNPRMTVVVATWFWTKGDLNKWADKDDVFTITKRINGGTNGLPDRRKHLAHAKAVLGIT